jgi:outer membrane receptor protein involved in Fe transport
VQADEPNTPADNAATLENIVVYGSRTSSTLRDTLSSVGVVTQQEINDLNLRSFREAFRTLGNVMDGDWADAGFIIRGVNSEGLTPGGAPLASLYLDGAQQTVVGTRRGARGLWDVKQIEVYRGPQSTMSGRASLAGAIYIKTEDPQFDWDAKVRTAAGSDDLKNGAIAFGGPIIDNQLAFRIAAEYESSENKDINYPDYENFNNYDDFVKDEYYQYRGKLLYLPDALPDTRMLLTFAMSHDSPSIRDIAGPELGFDFDERRGDFNIPAYTESRTAETDNTTLEINHALNEHLDFTSLSSYSHSDLDRPSINEGTPGETDVTKGSQVQKLFTQELRLNYDRDAWAAVAGLYFADEQDEGHYNRNAFGRADLSKSEYDTYNSAAFGEVSYEYHPGWKAIAGGRADYTEQDNSNLFSRNSVVSTDEDISSDEFVFLPKVGLLREFNAEQQLGFTAQRGFRSGGAGVQVSTGDTYDYDPEYTWTYEISYKGLFDNGQLSLNSNIFYTDWEDQQVELMADPLDFSSAITKNAAHSSSYGAELESRYQFATALSGFMSLGYVKTEFDDFTDVNLGDLTGLPFPEAPEWSFAFGGQYRLPAGFYLGVDTKYLSSYYARFGSLPHDKIDSHWITNAQLGYQTDKWELSLFAENAFDKDYFVYRDSDYNGDIAATLGMGRVVGVIASYNF